MNEIPIIIDVEASGLGAGSYPIEVGIAVPGAGDYCSLIRPELDWLHWDEEFAREHGLSRETLQQYGKPATKVAAQLNQIIYGETVYSDRWRHDRVWLDMLFQRASLKRAFTLEPLTAIMSDHQMRIWERSKWQVIKEFGLHRHRASSDAKILQLTYLRSMETRMRLL